MGSKEYYEWVLCFVERSWPTLFETGVRKVSARDCEQWLAGRTVFQEAIGDGARFKNPADGLFSNEG
jgi:hypothetical protein